MIRQDLYNVVATGSSGNCEIARERVMIDCGVPYSKIKKYMKHVQLCVITHCHKDHLNMTTIRKLSAEHPLLRFAIGEYLQEQFEGIRNVDVLDLNQWYNYGRFSIALGKLYHDVPNVFVRLNFNGWKVFRATDTQRLEGITAKDYDLYAIEANYDEETVWDTIHALEAQGKYAHQRGAINSHLSFQQANDFYYKNKGENSQLIRLHESKIF